MTKYDTFRDPLVRALSDEYSQLSGLRKGARVAVKINRKTSAGGVIRYADEIPEKEPGMWLGIELDSSAYGKNYGNIGSRTVFVLEKNRRRDGSLKPKGQRKKYGMFVRPADVKLVPASNLKPGTKVWVTNLLPHPVIRYDFESSQEGGEEGSEADSELDEDELAAKARKAQLARETRELHVIRNNITIPKRIDPDHPELNLWEEEGRLPEDAETSFRAAPKTVSGTVRFVGQTQFAYGTWVGVELDDPHFGKNFGYVDGVRYFTCKKNMRTPDETLQASMEKFVAEQESSRSSREADRLHTGAFTHLRWGYEVYRRIQAGETTEEEEVRKEIARRRHKRRIKDKRLADLKMIDISERVAYGVFVRPDRVVINDTYKELRRKRRKEKAKALAELEARLEEHDLKIINGGADGDATIRELLSNQPDAIRLPKGPDAAVVPVFPPQQDSEIVVAVRKPVFCDVDDDDPDADPNASATASSWMASMGADDDSEYAVDDNGDDDNNNNNNDNDDDDIFDDSSSVGGGAEDAAGESNAETAASALDAIVDRVAAAAGVDEDEYEYEFIEEEESMDAGPGADADAPPSGPIPGVVDDDAIFDDTDSEFSGEAF